MMKTTLWIVGLALGFFLMLQPAVMASADTTQTPASKFIEKLGSTALSALTGKDLTSREREKRVRDLLRANFDLQTIGRFALGTYWKTATDTQKKEYLSLFEDMIVKTYAQRFSEYSGQSFKVAGSMPASDRDSIVSSQVIQDKGPAVNLEWRVRDKSGSLKVVDVIVEGVSMSVTQRSDFGAVIQKKGGNLDGLIETLRLRKNGAIAEKAEK